MVYILFGIEIIYFNFLSWPLNSFTRWPRQAKRTATGILSRNEQQQITVLHFLNININNST